MKKSKIIVYVFGILVMCSCDYSDGKLVVRNLSNDTIFVNFNSDGKIIATNKPLYYRNDSIFKQYKFEGCLLPGKEENLNLLNTSWEKYLSRIPDGKVKVVIHTKQLLDTTQWEKIVSEQISTTIIEQNLQDLKSRNWLIEYK